MNPIIVTAAVCLILLLTLTGAAYAYSRYARAKRCDATEHGGTPRVADGPELKLGAQSGREDAPADDVIGPGHPMHKMMMLALDGNVVHATRNDGGEVEITDVRPVN